MTISAIVIADSVSCQGIRLTTFQLRYPRFIHSELMTHRTFSRNASSSRAIPVQRMIEDLRRDSAIPVYWGSHKPGMQAGDEIAGVDRVAAEGIWKAAMEGAIFHAESLIDRGLHKQIANRILEPWAHINVVVTATDYENFFALRRHSDAQPEIKALADAMWEAREASEPERVLQGQWHLPYVPHWERSDIVLATTGKPWDRDWDQEDYKAMVKISVARCARVSYLTHDGKRTTVEEDLKLYERLVGSMPLHASPAEHQATPDELGKSLVHTEQHGSRTLAVYPEGRWKKPHLHGNLRGWIQYRKTLPGEFTPG